jgi:hypothetical protein
MKTKLATLSILALTLAVGCQAARTKYYNAWEAMGYAKRERLVDNVKSAAKSQDKAKEQFVTALEEFKSVVNFDGGNLEKTYNRFDKAYQSAESRANDVHGRIDSVENVSKSLFSEWKTEISEIQDASIKRSSQKLYDDTFSSYEQLIERMKKAESSMTPVLASFRDRTLFLKHSLNAQAIASLQGEASQISADVDRLIAEMEASIREADEFVSKMKS